MHKSLDSLKDKSRESELKVLVVQGVTILDEIFSKKTNLLVR